MLFNVGYLWKQEIDPAVAFCAWLQWLGERTCLVHVMSLCRPSYLGPKRIRCLVGAAPGDTVVECLKMGQTDRRTDIRQMLICLLLDMFICFTKTRATEILSPYRTRGTRPFQLWKTWGGSKCIWSHALPSNFSAVWLRRCSCSTSARKSSKTRIYLQNTDYVHGWHYWRAVNVPLHV